MTLAKPPLLADDDALVAQRSALATLYAERYGDFVALAGLTSGRRHSAEDLVQDAFAGAYRRTTPFRDLDTISGYVARSVINGARSEARRRRPTVELDPDHDLPAAVSAELSVQLLGDREVVRAALATLPPRQRECAVCHFQFGLSQTETAAVLGLRHGTVKTHLGRARRALVRALEEHT